MKKNIGGFFNLCNTYHREKGSVSNSKFSINLHELCLVKEPNIYPLQVVYYFQFSHKISDLLCLTSCGFESLVGIFFAKVHRPNKIILLKPMVSQQNIDISKNKFCLPHTFITQYIYPVKITNSFIYRLL